MRVVARRLTVGGLVSAAVLGTLLMASSLVDAAPGEKFRGKFGETDAGALLGYNITGSAKMEVGPASTWVVVEIEGLTVGEIYGSHLHNGSCAEGGGGHYQDVEGGLITPPNELWLATPGESGIAPQPNQAKALADGSADWAARTDAVDETNARSVVVHKPGTGTRIACADLE